MDGQDVDCCNGHCSLMEKHSCCEELMQKQSAPRTLMPLFVVPCLVKLDPKKNNKFLR